MGKKILFKYPSRQRKNKLFESLDRFYSLITHDDYLVVCTFDIDDAEYTTDDFKDRINAYPNLVPMWGISYGKVSSINRDLSFFDKWDIIVLLSDDMILQPGFDKEILKSFEDGFSGLVHFPDGIVNEKLCTFSIMDRAYYAIFDYIYNPVYQSIACDNEQHEVAVKLGRYKYVPVDIVRHLHPAYGMAENDDLYRRNEHPALYAKDLETLAKRRAENYGL